MRLPVEVQIRQDEMRRAATVREESEDRSFADDCATILEAWWARRTALEGVRRPRINSAQIAKLARRMRAVGQKRPSNPQTARKP